jgi:hypothetical protein
MNLVQDARHFAYAILASQVMCPFDHIRSAMELVDDVPPFTFTATSSATALLVFTSPEAHEQAISFLPFSGGGIPNVYACVYSCRQCWASKCRGL